MVSLRTDHASRYNFYRYCILGNTTSTIKEVSDILIGLHSARLISPYASLISRIEGLRTESLYNDVVSNGNLIKLRCMRKTLHTVPLELASIVHNATLKYRIAEIDSYYRRFFHSVGQIRKIKEKLLSVLAGDHLPVNAITKKLSSHYDSGLVKMVLKELWERGTICYINESDDWQKEKRKYALTKVFYPGLDLHSLDERSAQKLLINKYIDNYGPVTLRDICWWSALPVGRVTQINKEGPDRVAQVRMTGFE